MEHISRDEAFALLKKYNKDPFHIQHALTVEAVMKWCICKDWYTAASYTGRRQKRYSPVDISCHSKADNRRTFTGTWA